MVRIPTTERKFYNNQQKVNTFEAYATTAYNAWLGTSKTYREIKSDQEKTKIDSFQTDANLELNDITNNWRVQNESDPTNPEALNNLNSQYEDVFSKYREQIDPIARRQWDDIARNIKGQYDLNNQKWGFKQSQLNAENYIKNSMSNYYKMASNYGVDGDVDGFLSTLSSGYNQMLDNGARVLGVETAASLLNNFEENSSQSFINGLAETSPEQAMELLKDPRLGAMLGKEKQKTLTNLMKNQIRALNYQKKLNEFNMQNDVINAINSVDDPVAQYHILEANKDSLSPAFYKKQLKIINKDRSINAEDRASFVGGVNDTLLDLQTNENLSDEEMLDKANGLLDLLDDGYEKGYINKKTYTIMQNKVRNKLIFPRQNNQRAINVKFNNDVAIMREQIKNLGFYRNGALNDIVSFMDSDEYENARNKTKVLDEFVQMTKNKYLMQATQDILGQGYILLDLDKGYKITPSIRTGTRVILKGKTYVFTGGDYKDRKNYEEVEE